MSGWMSQPSQGHNALVLSADDDEAYPWVCSCGAGDAEDTYEDAHHAVNEHLEHYRWIETPCAGLACGQHWYELVVTLAHELAGNQDQFPRHLSAEEIHSLFRQATAMLLSAQPDADQRCRRICRRWEQEIGIDDLAEVH